VKNGGGRETIIQFYSPNSTISPLIVREKSDSNSNIIISPNFSEDKPISTREPEDLADEDDKMIYPQVIV
jgi:hypothetical protein